MTRSIFFESLVTKTGTLFFFRLVWFLVVEKNLGNLPSVSRLTVRVLILLSVVVRWMVSVSGPRLYGCPCSWLLSLHWVLLPSHPPSPSCLNFQFLLLLRQNPPRGVKVVKTRRSGRSKSVTPALFLGDYENRPTLLSSIKLHTGLVRLKELFRT